MTRSNLGAVPVLVYILTYPSSADLPKRDAIIERLGALFSAYPLLGCRVVDYRANKPSFETASIEPSSLLHDEPLRDEAPSWELQMQHIMQREMYAAISSFDVLSGKLWRVTLYNREDGRESYLTLAIHHILTDGLGGMHLLLKLAGLSPIPSHDGRGSLSPAFEATTKIKASIRLTLSVVAKEILKPILPNYISRVLGWVDSDHWPYQSLENLYDSCGSGKDPLSASAKYRVYSISASRTSMIRSAGKARNVQALQQVLGTALSVALLFIETSTSQLPVVLSTPMSTRSDFLGHPDATGNYVLATPSYEYQLAQDADFWTLAREYGKYLIDPHVKQLGRERWALMDWWPDNSNDPNDKASLNGWESALLQGTQTSRPFSSSLEVSNLGLFPLRYTSEQNAACPSRFVWSQSAQPFGCAVTHSVAGFAGGRGHEPEIVGTVAWLLDSAPADRASEANLNRYMVIVEKVFAVLAEQSADESRALLLSELREAVEKP